VRVIYLAGPIIGQTWHEMNGWREDVGDKLRSYGYKVLSPLSGEKMLWPDEKMDVKTAKRMPAGLGRATWSVDRARVQSSDICLFNFVGAKKVSIGSIIELSWCFEWRKLAIVVMNRRNVHRHPWVKEIMGGVIFETMPKALSYMKELAVEGCDVQPV